ncbi:MAG: anthranilate synthase component I family protein [Desulfovibrio sp.]|jgi:anthranilate synthase component 1|nr:anthranilate synthase component I family protein [Desulfovibrio sp.]
MRLRLAQHCTLLDSDLETPVGMFIRLVGDRQGILLESAETDGRWGRYSIIASDFLLSVVCRDGLLEVRSADKRLASLSAHSGKAFSEGLRALLRSLAVTGDPENPQPPITRAFYGYLGYGMAGILEKKLASVLPAAEAEASLALPGSLLVFDHGYNRITRITLLLEGEPLESLPDLPPAGTGKDLPGQSSAFGETDPAGPAARIRPARTEGKAGYLAAVARVKEMLHQGEGIQVVLSTPFSAPLVEKPFNLYRRLRRMNPSPYMFYMSLPDGALLGSSPEVLVSCSANRLTLCPIAGTRPRGQDPAADAFFGDELLQDPKEKAEHVMLVDLGRNDLGRIAKAGSVRLDRFMELEKFSHVMHLTSRISADLAPGLDALDVAAATFPAGTVSGAPKIRAMEIIAQEEDAPRGPYAGAVGWLGLDADAVHLDFGIIIRSLWVRAGRVHWQAGAGIVHDSEPEREWLECLAKAEVIRQSVLQ